MRDRILAASTPRVTTADAFCGKPASTDCAVRLHSFTRVTRAGRCVAATGGRAKECA